jgi:WD40 repeat protein
MGLSTTNPASEEAPVGANGSDPASPAEATDSLSPAPTKTPRKLTRLQRELLIAALVDALDYGRMTQLATFVFDDRPDVIFNPRWLITEIAREIVAKAETERRLEALQTEAEELNPDNSLLRSWSLELTGLKTSPYRGLAPFREQDQGVFFGREPFVDRLLEAVGRHPIVVLTGPSGIGKSSLVCAGLVPVLRDERRNEWAVARFCPGRRPFLNLASCLVPFLEPTLGQVDQLLERDAQAVMLRDRAIALADVIDSIREMPDAPPRFLLIADQFEAAIPPAIDAEESQAFLDVLLGAFARIEDRPPAAVLLLTMRADTIGRARSHPLLAEALQSAEVKLESMGGDDLQLAIEGPAKGTIDLAPGLALMMANDALNQPGGLALLQLKMTRLAELLIADTRDDRVALLLPQVEAAIFERADGVIARLGGDSPQLRRIFRHLVKVDEGSAVDRLQATRADLGDEAWALVYRLADERLVVTGYDDTRDVETVELAHDAWLATWPTLRAWIAEEADFLRWLQRLRVAQAEWEKPSDTPEASDALLPPSRLIEAEDWLAEREGDLSPAQREFIAQSAAKRATEREEEAAAQQAELKRRTQYVQGAVAACLVLLALVGWALWERKSAVDAQRAAQTAEGLANAALATAETETANRASVQLAQLARDRIEDQPDLALLLGVEAIRKSDTPGARESVLRALAASPRLEVILAESEPNAPITSIAFSPDGDLLAAGSSNGSIALWDIAAGRLLGKPIPGDDLGIRILAFAPTTSEPAALVAGTLDGELILWEIEDAGAAHLRARIPAHEDAVTSMAFVPGGSLLATGSADATVKLWDVARGETWQLRERGPQIPRAADMNVVTGVAISPDGQTLAVSAVDEAIRLWDIDTGEPGGDTLHGPADIVWSIAYSPLKPPMLAAGGSDGRIILWDPVQSSPLAQVKGHEAAVTAIAFSGDGKYLASGGWDGSAIQWDVNRAVSDQKHQSLSGHDDRITSVAFVPAELVGESPTSVVTAALDGGLLAWSVDAPEFRAELGQTTDFQHLEGVFTQSEADKQQGADKYSVKMDDAVLDELACDLANRNLDEDSEWPTYFPEEPYRATCFCEWAPDALEPQPGGIQG